MESRMQMSTNLTDEGFKRQMQYRVDKPWGKIGFCDSESYAPLPLLSFVLFTHGERDLHNFRMAESAVHI